MILSVTFAETTQRLDAQFVEVTQKFDTNFGEVQKITEYVGGEKYEGDYIVIPRIGAQTLHTKEKVMLEDVVINAIPYAEVTNSANGKTVTIA